MATMFNSTSLEEDPLGIKSKFMNPALAKRLAIVKILIVGADGVGVVRRM
jgi:hypothetical protein